ncbi:MAG: hypothetical protein JXA35_02395, partial [Deltaproteobacteria bacterium]|nr:hypothetical protein [Deltaproteobacteria bacterium]
MKFNSIINGWDIGGVNIKAMQINSSSGPVSILRSINTPFEIWHNPDELAARLNDAGNYLDIKDDQPHGVTITAELSDAFRTKREGIHFILDAFKKAFFNSPVFIFNLY